MFVKNRRYWDAQSAGYQRAHGVQLAREPLAWGVWRIPESDVRALGVLEGKRVLEFGCGAAQWTCALRANGVSAVGIDLSAEQLRHGAQHAAELGVHAPLVHGDAQRLPFRDQAFDLVFCDHGAMSFADPHAAVAEAARVLRHDGQFVFCMATPLHDICCDPVTGAFTGRLDGDYFGLGPLDDGESVTAQLTYGDWIRLFRRHSLRVDDLIELQAPAESATTYTDFVEHGWARRWPGEHIWRLTRT